MMVFEIHLQHLIKSFFPRPDPFLCVENNPECPMYYSKVIYFLVFLVHIFVLVEVLNNNPKKIRIKKIFCFLKIRELFARIISWSFGLSICWVGTETAFLITISKKNTRSTIIY